MSSQVKIKESKLPNIPWQDRPEGRSDVLWRYDSNPIIPRDAIPHANSIFNSAVVPFEGEFAGVFRIDDDTRGSYLHAARSQNALDWDIDHDRIQFKCDDPEIGEFVNGYDPRVVWIEDRYYVTWCNDYHGPTIGVAWTKDFKTFHQLENAFLPFNRNGVMFPRKIDGKFAMLSRPSDTGHTPFGDIFYSESPDMAHWGCHRHVMSPANRWDDLKVGAGPIPIETSEGWLLIYHGVLNSCNGYVYSMGAALLDLEEPWKVIARGRRYLLSPKTYEECVGDVPNVAFPCAALVDSETNRIAVYYGAADTVVNIAFGYVHEIVDYIKKNSL